MLQTKYRHNKIMEYHQKQLQKYRWICEKSNTKSRIQYAIVTIALICRLQTFLGWILCVGGGRGGGRGVEDLEIFLQNSAILATP